MRKPACSFVHFIVAATILLLRGASADEALRVPAAKVNSAASDYSLPETFRVPPIDFLGWDAPADAPPASTELPSSTPQDLGDLLQRLQAAEQRIAELERANEVADNPQDSSTPGLFPDKFKEQLDELWQLHQAKKASSRPTVSVLGRMHLESLALPRQSPGTAFFENPSTGTKAEDRIQFRRIRIGAQGNILQTGVYRMEFDFGNPSRPTFRDTYIGFEELPLVQTLLIGNQKRPLGLDAWASNQHVVFFERPLAINAFNPNYRRIGIETYGHSKHENVNWQAGVFELQDLKEIGRDLNDPIHFSINTRLSGTPWYDEISGGRGYLHLGISNMYATTAPALSPSGNNDDVARFSVKPELQTTSSWIDTGMILGATRFNVTGFEAVLNVGSLQLQGEYLTTFVDRIANSNLAFEGGYVQIAYFLTGEFEEWDRQTGRLARPKPLENFFLVCTQGHGIGSGWGAWQVAARWSYLSLSDDDVLGGRQEDATFGLNWYWTPHSKVMFNVVTGHIWDRAPVHGFSAGHFTGLGARILMDI